MFLRCREAYRSCRAFAGAPEGSGAKDLFKLVENLKGFTNIYHDEKWWFNFMI